MAKQWQVKQNEKILGPFSDSQMKKLVATGRVHKKTPVRSADNSIWFTAGRFPELFPVESPTHSGSAPEAATEYAEVDDKPKSIELWHVGRDGESFGPFTRQQLSDRVRNGWLRPNDLVWKPEYADWKPAKTIKGLFPEISQQPIAKARRSQRSFLSAEDFRYPGESTALLIACSLLLLLIVVTTAATVGIALAVIGISVVVFKIQESGILSRCIPVGPHNDPELYSLAQMAADRLCVPLPPLFIEKNPEWNAHAIGFLGTASVLLNSSLVKDFDQDELLFIIGHELAHLKCGHTNWGVFTDSSSNVLRNPVFHIIADVFFKSWSRKSEFTCDRGGLLACRNPKAAVSALAKISLGPEVANEKEVKRLLNQIKLAGDRVWNSVDGLLDTHPQTEKRIQAVAEFWRSDYKRLTEE